MMHLLILILGFMLLPEASALQCYACNRTDTNPNNDDCGKAVNCVLSLFTDVECFSMKESGNYIVKGCLPKQQCALMKAFVPPNVPMEVGCCEGDLCNAAPASTATASLLLLLAPVLSVAALVFS